ncbi:helix-turn-helix domain-containing protein [Aquimarina sediminis]|uniref:helix-turn-helix domain-containing protein n=1 Tax=Aquimarina sediminis TaxID=2070536 RepID=UPI000CA0161E|nr:helix-turn-helix domain-containing protein [Aquimarina sediminis]
MNYQFTNKKEQSIFTITDFSDSSERKSIQKNSNFIILWAYKNSASIYIDGYSVPIKKNCIIFCTPHNKINLDKSTFGSVMAFIFNREFYCIRDHDNEVSCNGLLFYGSHQPSEIKLKDLNLETFKMAHLMFEEEFRAYNDSLHGEMLRVILKQILITCTRLFKDNLEATDVSDEKIDITRKYNILVEKFFREKHKVKDYAEIMNVSPKTISNIFYSFYKRKPSEIITERIMLEARRLILFSDKNLSEISILLGFKELSHFSKFFKKHMGVSPRQFKKSYEKI